MISLSIRLNKSRLCSIALKRLASVWSSFASIGARSNRPKAARFEWAYFDTILRETRARNLRVVGILGDTAPWASVATSTFGGDQRQSPPRPDAYDGWKNYVRRTVGRYGNDVLAWQVWENPNSVNFPFG